MLIGNRQFVNGSYDLAGDMSKLGDLFKYFASFNAFYEGSDEYKAAKLRDAKMKGWSNDSGSILKGDEGSAEGEGGTNITSTIKTPNAEGFAGNAPDLGASVASANDGLGTTPGSGVSDQPQMDLKLIKVKKAALSLDPANDAHWTGQGKPAVIAVEEAFGSGGITRSDIEAAMGVNWNRQTAMDDSLKDL
jgi:hypothetical protein